MIKVKAEMGKPLHLRLYEYRASEVHLVEQGFSLVELLLVLAIVLMLMVAVAPLQLNVIDSAQLRKTKQEIIAGMRFSRSKAINSQEVVTLAINAADGRMTIGNENRELHIPDDVILTMRATPLEQLSEHENAISFYPDGSSTGLELLFRRGERVIQINVDRFTGRVGSIEN